MKRVRDCVMVSMSRAAVTLAATAFVYGPGAVWAQTGGSQATRQSNVPSAQSQNQNPPQPRADQPVTQESRQSAQSDQAGQQNARADQSTRSSEAKSRGRQSNDHQDAGWLGVFLNPRQNDHGATISQVYPAGPAARAGIEPGDVIQQINGHQVNNGDDLVSALEGLHPGAKAEITVTRNNEPTKLTATLGNRDSYLARGRGSERSGGRASAGAQSEEEDFFNYPMHAMELEHNRRNAEQHQRIENEIAKLREEVHQLREALQRR
jgi:C-terminal processing protease CtpA/Prc